MCYITILIFYLIQDEKNDGLKTELTPFSDLDVKTMKIQELRDQLDARGLVSKGNEYFIEFISIYINLKTK